MNPEWFAGRLKELREGAGLTRDELAERAGLSKFGISDLEQGRRLPGWETVLLLCQALGVECTAFAQQPATSEKVGRGRPRKPDSESDKPAAKSRKRKK
jgi:transcriptional regulator with XRE-family HTH domain